GADPVRRRLRRADVERAAGGHDVDRRPRPAGVPRGAEAIRARPRPHRPEGLSRPSRSTREEGRRGFPAALLVVLGQLRTLTSSGRLWVLPAWLLNSTR